MYPSSNNQHDRQRDSEDSQARRMPWDADPARVSQPTQPPLTSQASLPYGQPFATFDSPSAVRGYPRTSTLELFCQLSRHLQLRRVFRRRGGRRQCLLRAARSLTTNSLRCPAASRPLGLIICRAPSCRHRSCLRVRRRPTLPPSLTLGQARSPRVQRRRIRCIAPTQRPPVPSEPAPIPTLPIARHVTLTRRLRRAQAPRPQDPRRRPTRARAMRRTAAAANRSAAHGSSTAPS